MGKSILSLVMLSFLFAFQSRASIFGEENIALTKLVVGQIEEIRQLTETLGVAKDQMEILRRINDGIYRATATISTIEEIVRRAKGLDPKSIRRISDLTILVYELKGLHSETQRLLILKTEIADEAIMQAGTQSETAYLMGQEMIRTGGTLSAEAQTASPGRAAQITASSSANSMLSDGVQLQTLAQIAQMQAISLDLQKSQVAETAKGESERGALYARQVSAQGDYPTARKIGAR